METLRLASASSPIALAQTARVGYLLEKRLPPLRVVDVILESPLDPTKQVNRLIERLREGDVDATLCSAVRLPVPLPEGIALGAVLRDRDPRYRCVSPGAPLLDFLPRNSKVVTCDAVARAQVLHRFPRLMAELFPPSWEIFAGLRHGAWEAACLPPEVFDVGSLSGLKTEPIIEQKLLPAVGQGSVALLIRADADRVRRRLSDINDPDLEFRLTIERLFVSRVSGESDCVATARVSRVGAVVELTGLLGQRDGEWLVLVQSDAVIGAEVQAARELADSCLSLAHERRADRASRQEVFAH